MLEMSGKRGNKLWNVNFTYQHSYVFWNLASGLRPGGSTQHSTKEEMKYGDDLTNTLGFVEKFVKNVRLRKKLARVSAEITEKSRSSTWSFFVGKWVCCVHQSSVQKTIQTSHWWKNTKGQNRGSRFFKLY